MKSGMASIRLDCNYKFISLESIRIQAEPNQHGKACITGIIEEGTENDVVGTNKERIRVIETGEEEKILFSGIVDEISLRHDRNVNYIKILACSDTILMDIQKKRRSFQHKQNPYKKIFEKISKDHGGSVLDKATNGMLQGRVIIQYDETDWEFLKRVASQFGAVLIPDICADKPQIYIGVPELDQEVQTEVNYTSEKMLLLHDKTAQNFTPKSELDHVAFQIKSEKHYDIGTKVRYGDRNLTVVSKEIIAKEDKLEKAYVIKKREGIYQNFIKNEKFTGLSIEGKVLAVEKDTVKVHLTIDESQPLGEANWFQWNTGYTTEGQTGLYIMPQVGGHAQLYIPEADEDKAYIRTIVRKDGEQNSKTQDTATKYLGNTYGKELKMAPGELKLTANGGLYIKMNDKTGIEIESNKEMTIKSNSYIEFRGYNVDITAGESIYYEVNGSSISMDNITHIKGNKIKINGTKKS